MLKSKHCMAGIVDNTKLKITLLASQSADKFGEISGGMIKHLFDNDVRQR